ncbi:winged helix-turn-helix transcriptional regulator [Phytoactinopolyspora alkaliphila]|uniref:Winged helix-turn-helix transcriptional regulator n=1 Tax=Phytoactinopolyspora alkaliphila TaxID=1783498 RepID=A0A6N9YLR4_9ACTN|nr:winged helix-turn-helix transcriptional regulator [Phytoactinopolyspora alkaliphila]
MPAVPDYALDDVLELTEPVQYRALFEKTRLEVCSLLLERAATISDLAVALGKPKGTVGHHLKVLEEAGLVHVVRTKKVRAIEAKYYGRTARVFIFHKVGEAAEQPQQVLSTAAAEIAAVPEDTDLPVNSNIRYARIPTERAEEWSRRLDELIIEFGSQPRGGDVIYGFAIAVYPTDRARLPDAGETGAADEAVDE